MLKVVRSLKIACKNSKDAFLSMRIDREVLRILIEKFKTVKTLKEDSSKEILSIEIEDFFTSWDKSPEPIEYRIIEDSNIPTKEHNLNFKKLKSKMTEDTLTFYAEDDTGKTLESVDLTVLYTYELFSKVI